MGVGFHGGSSSGWGGNDDSGSEAAGSAEHVVSCAFAGSASGGCGGGSSGGDSAGRFRGRPPALLEGPAPATSLFLALGIVTFLPGRPMPFEQLRCTCRGSGGWGASCQ